MRAGVIGCASVLLTLAGCGGGVAAPAYEVVVLVEGASVPLAGVPILRDGTRLGDTGPDGIATLHLSGAEGEIARIGVQCPPEHQGPPGATAVPLYTLANPSHPPLYRISCRPTVNSTVVAVRAVNGPGLPVTYLGKEIARTDASGVAHVGLRLHPGERFELRLDTRGQALVPESPTAVFVARAEDELLFFDQRFELPVRRSRGGRRGPRAF